MKSVLLGISWFALKTAATRQCLFPRILPACAVHAKLLQSHIRQGGGTLGHWKTHGTVLTTWSPRSGIVSSPAVLVQRFQVAPLGIAVFLVQSIPHWGAQPWQPPLRDSHALDASVGDQRETSLLLCSSIRLRLDGMGAHCWTLKWYARSQAWGHCLTCQQP